MVEKEYRIGVITPHLDGEYYGRIIPYIHEYVTMKNSQLFVIQAMDENLGMIQMEEPVAFNLIDAWIFVLPSVSAMFQEMVDRSTKPVVAIGFLSNSSQSYSVVLNNIDSMKQAVLHLIDAHGHRDIAFIAYTDQYDLNERYLGYCEALKERGIPIDERLFVLAKDNLLDGGLKATQQLLSRGIPFTALVCGTDLNALGAIDILQKQGYKVPDDIAVIGFDDIHQASTGHPSLTTVRQPFETIGRETVNILYRLLEGQQDVPRFTNIQALFVPRASCGCADPTFVSTPDEFIMMTKSLSMTRNSLYVTTANHYQMTRGLIMATKQENIHISNLFWNLSHWGCLALWEVDKMGTKKLVIKQTFSRHGDPLPPLEEAYALEDFPPVAYLPPDAQPGGKDMVILRPIKTELHDWGYIALSTLVDPQNSFVANDLSRHSFTILAVALEREMLFNRIRSFAEKLEIVSRTTNDGIWDWNIKSNKIEWNIRAYMLLNAAGVIASDDSLKILEQIHSEDRDHVREAFVHTFKGEPLNEQPISLEFRIVGSSGQQMWVYVAGDVMRDSGGNVTRLIGSLTDITEKKDNEARIMTMAYHDALTGLPNRLLFHDRLSKALDERIQSGGKLAVFMIDLDRFKLVNDTMGHQVGDELLCQVALQLQDCLYEQDTIARLGGDEFIVLLPNIESEKAVHLVADRLLKRLSKAYVLKGMEFFLSASIGVSLYPTHGEDAELLIQFADIAMYQTKRSGGNRMRIYTPELGSQQSERVWMENGLRRALEQSEFVLHFQPQIALASGKVYGAEALIRWNTPDGKQVSPGDFIPLAEETGLIIPIGQWVLEKACMECMRWINEGLTDIVVSVNISAQQFQQGFFPERIRKVLKDTGIRPSNLCLEITEYMAVLDIEHSIKVLRELVDIGVKIAIDDFGIGQSSLVLLKKLPIHMVKIDPSFILNMIEDHHDEAISKGIIDMSHRLGLSVTAEGVETEQQLRRLQELECDRIQGYFMGRPMPSDQFIAYYKNIST
ncbi:MAG: EAL domain-containing protein [Candidatus Cohnella colombiensis]|uniref:EAL domain-containing protein n=1 Tax=Candidatus Cohnella colombiensis TaxID=3121368 RepID=A0AA95JF95_9BACL|nr:MAG: EAL domain-containing protein [Cohnella sp.]